jgi:ATP-binding cassette, subfamily B, bacterial
VDDLAHGRDTLVGERGVTLSGGQRQRLALARALLRHPRLLLLDDATSAIDPVIEQRILDGLREQLDTTTLVVAHRVATIRLADRVLFLDGGRSPADGTHEELLARDPQYAALVRAYEQAGEADDEAEVTTDDLPRRPREHELDDTAEPSSTAPSPCCAAGLAATPELRRSASPSPIGMAVSSGAGRWPCRCSSSRSSTGACSATTATARLRLPGVRRRRGRHRRAVRPRRATYLRLIRTAENALYALRVRTFDHIHRLAIADHTESRRGELVARVTSDVETLAQFTQWGAIAWIVNSSVILGTLAVMLVYSWQLALVVMSRSSRSSP